MNASAARTFPLLLFRLQEEKAFAIFPAVVGHMAFSAFKVKGELPREHSYFSTAKGPKKAAIAYSVFVPSSARLLTGACPGSTDVEGSIKASTRKK